MTHSLCIVPITYFSVLCLFIFNVQSNSIYHNLNKIKSHIYYLFLPCFSICKKFHFVNVFMQITYRQIMSKSFFFYLFSKLTAVFKAISIICVKEFCLSSAVVASPVTKESETVKIANAFFPALAAFI